MKQQVMAIRGGTTFDTHEDYIAFLKTREVTLERLQQGDSWRASLQRELGAGFEVLLPKMPNETNARYNEWCIWFERCAALLQDNIILIGHSLGGIFLAKYLSERSFPKTMEPPPRQAAGYQGGYDAQSVGSADSFQNPSHPRRERRGIHGGAIKATLLVAAPFDDNSNGESLTDFALPSSLEKMSAQAGAMYLIHSKDDPVVPFGEVVKYQHVLPEAKQVIFDNRGHFNQETFPELVALIQSLAQ